MSQWCHQSLQPARQQARGPGRLHGQPQRDGSGDKDEDARVDGVVGLPHRDAARSGSAPPRPPGRRSPPGTRLRLATRMDSQHDPARPAAPWRAAWARPGTAPASGRSGSSAMRFSEAESPAITRISPSRSRACASSVRSRPVRLHTLTTMHAVIAQEIHAADGLADQFGARRDHGLHEAEGSSSSSWLFRSTRASHRRTCACECSSTPCSCWMLATRSGSVRTSRMSPAGSSSSRRVSRGPCHPGTSATILKLRLLHRLQLVARSSPAMGESGSSTSSV